MADYYTLQMADKQDEISVAFHVVLPDTTNFVSFSYRTALSQYLTDTVSRVPYLVQTEQDKLDSGELIEIVETVKFDGNLTLVQKRDIIDARHATLSSEQITKYQNILEFWGLGRDII